MATSASVKDILNQVKNLNKQDQLTLLEQIAVLLENREAKKSKVAKLSTLSGIGSDIWRSTEKIDQYLTEERQW